jgi:23S rRNA pseudouridine1911/1915/1917 synthase
VTSPVTVAVTARGRLDEVLAEALADASRSACARWVRDGRVTVDGRTTTRPATVVTPGQQVVVARPEPRAASARPEALPLRFVYQDADLAVVDKAPGMVVHPSAGHDAGTLVNALLHHLADLSGIGGALRPGIVHRLDRGTSGLLVVAKHDAAHRSLATQFASHRARRSYLAIVHDPPAVAEVRIESRLGRHPTDRLRQASQPEGRGRRAVTHLRVLARVGSVGLVRCELETGRTHQVRVHLSEHGCPIVGDVLYRRRSSSPLPATLRGRVDETGARPLLHAFRLALVAPCDGRPLVFEAPVPLDMSAVLAALGLDATACTG